MWQRTLDALPGVGGGLDGRAAGLPVGVPVFLEQLDPVAPHKPPVEVLAIPVLVPSLLAV